MLEVCENEECVEKVWAVNVKGNVLKRVTRITKSDGDVEPHVVSGRVS